MTKIIHECIDCNAYDDTSQPDTFLRAFGDIYFICEICAEFRGIESEDS
jgi:hypothetical protein